MMMMESSVGVSLLSTAHLFYCIQVLPIAALCCCVLTFAALWLPPFCPCFSFAVLFAAFDAPGGCLMPFAALLPPFYCPLLPSYAICCPLLPSCCPLAALCWSFAAHCCPLLPFATHCCPWLLLLAALGQPLHAPSYAYLAFLAAWCVTARVTMDATACLDLHFHRYQTPCLHALHAASSHKEAWLLHEHFSDMHHCCSICFFLLFAPCL